LGALVCLPFGGLFTLLLPLILIGAVVYFLVNRQQSGLAPPVRAGGYCPQCEKPVNAGDRFCVGCGRQFS
jgi:hypothetical protein